MSDADAEIILEVVTEIGPQPSPPGAYAKFSCPPPVWWRTADLNDIRIVDMQDSHLSSALRVVTRITVKCLAEFRVAVRDEDTWVLEELRDSLLHFYRAMIAMRQERHRRGLNKVKLVTTLEDLR